MRGKIIKQQSCFSSRTTSNDLGASELGVVSGGLSLRHGERKPLRDVKAELLLKFLLKPQIHE